MNGITKDSIKVKTFKVTKMNGGNYIRLPGNIKAEKFEVWVKLDGTIILVPEK